MPALFTTMSSPPSSDTVCATADSHCASSVTSSSTNAAPSMPGGGLLADVLRDVGDHHPRPRRGERLRHPGAQAACGPGDQRHPSGQIQPGHLLVLL